MIKRFISGVLTVSMLMASMTAFAENNGVSEVNMAEELVKEQTKSGNYQNGMLNPNEPSMQLEDGSFVQHIVHEANDDETGNDYINPVTDFDDSLEDAPVELMASVTSRIVCKRRIKIWGGSRGTVQLYSDATVSNPQDCYKSDVEVNAIGYVVLSDGRSNFYFNATNGDTGQSYTYYVPYDNYKVTYVAIYHTNSGNYNTAHPHYAKCACGETLTSYTTTKTTCTTCYPPKVYYYANGGSGAPSYSSGYPLTISSTIPTRFPYKFKGWNTSSSASSASYVGGNSYYGSANSSTSMYAVWENANNLNLTSNSTGSTYISPQGVTGYWKFTAPETATYAFESTGSYDTYGYLYNSSGTSLSSNDDGGDGSNFKITYALTKDTIYYLGTKYYGSTTGTINIKARRQYDVKYNANGGSGAPPAQSKLYGDSVTISSTEPTNGDFKFLGWSTSSTAKTATYSAGDTYSANSDVTLYAVYEPITGQCGDSLYWSLESNGTLTISGTGDMWDYDFFNSFLRDYKSLIKKIVINNGATSIGNYAFYNCRGLANVIIPDSVTSIGKSTFASCSGLTSITIPNSIISIGASAFEFCSGLASVTIPNSVTSIGGYAFKSCSGLKNITISNGVTSIGDATFEFCSGLTSVKIPNSVTSIGASAFESCSGLTIITIPESVKSIGKYAFVACRQLNISVNAENEIYCDIDGVLFSKDKTEIITYAKDGIETEYTIPNGVTSIGEYAFNGCSGLTSVAIPDSVTNIGSTAFSYCSGLKNMTISQNVTSIGEYAFNGCSGLTSMTIPDSVTNMGDAAFQFCNGLISITIPNGVTSIGNSTFYECNNLSDVYYRGTEIEWIDVTIANKNEPLRHATMHFISDTPVITESDSVIGKTVTITAQEGAEISCGVNDEELHSYGEPITLTEAGEYTIRATAIKEGNTTSAVTEKTITITKAPTPVSTVPAGQILKNRTIALSVDAEDAIIHYTTDGSSPTVESPVYTSPITIDEPKTIKAIAVKAGYAISDEAVYGYSILGVAPTVLINISNIDGGKSIILSNEIEEAKIYYTLDSTTPTDSSTLYTAPIEIKTAGVKYIKAIAVIENCANSPVTSDIVAVEKLDAPRTQNEVYRLEKGGEVDLIPPMPDAEIYYTLDGSTPTVESTKYTEKIIMNETATIKAVAVKQGYVTSDTASFAYAVYEKSETPIIEIKSDKGIYTAEIICDGADDIYYTLDGSEPKASSNKYSEPIALNEAKIYTIKAISVKAGYENSDISERKITLEKTVSPTSSVENGRIEKGTSVSLSGNGTIYYSINGAAESIYTEPIVIDINTEISAYAVENGKLRSDEVTFSYRTEKNTSGTDGAITWLYENGTLTISGSGAIPDYTEEIKPDWSELNDEIKRIVIEDEITTIGTYSFAGLENATSVTIPDSVLNIGNSAFDGCGGLIDIILPNKLISIGKDVFKNCDKLTELSVPDSVQVMGEAAFEGCNNLTSVQLPFVGSMQGNKNSEDVFSFIFGGTVPEALKKVIITNETVLPESAFKDCDKLESILINNELKSIGASAFDGCTALREMTIPDGVTAIRDNTFHNCENIVSIAIPDTVSEIGAGAFDGCKKLDVIHIPIGIKTINDYTFRDCEMLYSLEIPNSVESIGIDALKGCRMLHTLKIPFVGANANPGATAITNEGVLGYLFGKSDTGVVQGEFAYAIPPSLTKVEVVGTANGYIPRGAFMNCANIVDILIDGDKTICADAFYNCRLLNNLYIPRSISTIGSNILAGCVNLKTLTVPFIGTSRSDSGTETSVLGGFFGYDDDDITGVHQYYNEGSAHYYKIPGTLRNVSVLNQTNIPYGAFMECYGLEKVSIVSGAALNDKAFYNCTGLNKVLLPKDLLTMGKESFAECENLESINLPDGTKSIGDNSFYNARKMREITIPRSVEQIADEVFNGTGMFGLDTVELMASGVNIICASGSKAEEFAIEKGLHYTIVDDSELNIKQTSTTVELLSDNSYLFDVTDSYRQEGILHIDVYDAETNLLSSKTTEAGDVEYRISFAYEEIPDISYAVIYIEDEDGNLVTTGTELISVEGGEIPEIPENDIKLKYDDGKASVIGTGSLKKGTMLIQAVYEDDILKTVHTYNIQGLNIPIDIDTDFAEIDTVKLMVWESLDSMKPAADYLVI